MNTNPSQCSRCGARLDPDAPEEYCPACLLQDVIDGPAPGDSFPPGPERNEQMPGGLPRRFGAYEVLELIAQGGMGEIYRARDTILNRVVALKLLHGGPVASREFLARFQVEAQAAAQMNHPHIVPIFEAGEVDGQPYLAMHYIEGTPLSEELSGGVPLTQRRAAALVATVARAIHHAHQHGVLHRDLKPANILIDPEGRPHVTDFGLARFYGRDSSLTDPDTVMGSPAYMPPEQAEGRNDHVTTAADVYSLGAILYELLTGRPPFRGANVMETLRKVAQDEPVPPRVLHSHIARDLETVCLKCLEKDPAARFGSAEALAEELGRWLADEPVLARPAAPWERLGKWARRRPMVAGLLAALVLALAAGVAGVVSQVRVARRSADAARRSEAESRHRAYIGDMNLAQQAVDRNNFGSAHELLERYRLPGPAAGRGKDSRARPAVAPSDLRGWEWRHLWQECQGGEFFALRGHAERVLGAAFSPRDPHLLLTGGVDRQACLWDLNLRALLTAVTNLDRVVAVAFSPTGDHAFTVTADGWLQRRAPVTLRPEGPPLRSTSTAERLILAPDGSLLAAGPPLRLWDTASGAEIELADRRFDATPLQFSADGRLLAVAQQPEGAVTLLGLEGGGPRMRLRPRRDRLPPRLTLTALTFAADGRLATAERPGRGNRMDTTVKSVIRVGDPAGLRAPVPLEIPGAEFRALAFFGRFLAAGGTDQTLHVWDTATWSWVGRLRGHRSEITTLAVSRDGRLLASGSLDGAVLLWREEDCRPEPRRQVLLPSDQGRVGASLSSNGKTLLTLPSAGLLEWWDATGLKVNMRRALPGFDPASAVLDAHGRVAALADADGRVQVVSLEPFGALAGVTAPAGVPLALAIAPGGTALAVVGRDEKLRLWDLPLHPEAPRWEIPAAGAAALQFAPDGWPLAVGLRNGIVMLLEETPEREKSRPVRRRAPGENITTLAFSRDGGLLAAGSSDGRCSVWNLNLRTNVPMLTLPSVFVGLQSVAFSADARRLVLGDESGLIRVWDLTSRPPQPLGAFQGHTRPVTGLAFETESDALVSVSRDQLAVHRAARIEETDER